MASVAALLLVVLPGAAPEVRPAAPEPELTRLKAHVERLASPEFAGRRGEGARKAADDLIAEFRSLGLEPLFGDRYDQPIPGTDPDTVVGRNVGARLPGSDPALAGEWVLMAAHYDHLGVRDGVLYPGADDNASGVAALLEAARCLARAPQKPRRGVLFVGFDLEEAALWGSRHFVAEPPVPLESIALVLTADMLGRSLGGVCTDHVFVIGTEHAPGLRPWVEQAAAGRGVTVGLVGNDLLGIDRSDYGPFRRRGIPFLFFSTGENPTYHRPEDVPETLEWPKLLAVSRVILGVLRRAADADAVPGWTDSPDHPAAEAEVLRAVLRQLLEARDRLEIPSAVQRLMTRTLAQLDAAVARGGYAPGERARIVRVAQLVLFSVL